MASTSDLEADRFDVSGPAHIISRATPTMIDWNNEEYRRCVAASVVQGTYILENDRTKGRVLAPSWWESFNFHLIKHLYELLDHNGNKSIFGAIFKQRDPSTQRDPSAPQYIVAFRGTMLSNPKDINVDLKVIANTLPSCQRFIDARQAVIDLLGNVGFENNAVWLAGHSLGASLALDVGRAMMFDHGLNLPTFLFNPPHVSFGQAINMFLPSHLMRELHVVRNVGKAILGRVLNGHRKDMEALFERLSLWEPNLYVHDEDLVCKGFISYFEQRQQMLERYSVGVARSATMLSYGNMLFSLLGKEKERPHLLPSATLWKNSSMGEDVHGGRQRALAAHELQQWWKPDAELGLSKVRYSLP